MFCVFYLSWFLIQIFERDMFQDWKILFTHFISIFELVRITDPRQLWSKQPK